MAKKPIEKVERIIELESDYNHRCYMYEFDSIEQGIERFDEIQAAYGIMEKADDIAFTKAAGGIVSLITSSLLSPEAAAYILSDSGPNMPKTQAFLERVFKNRSTEELAIFQATYYREMLELSLHNVWSLTYRVHTVDVINDKYIRQYKDEKQTRITGKCAVYTCITGGYDNLADPQYIDPEFDYICYTDEPEKYRSDVWDIRKIEIKDITNPILLNRYVKTHPHELLPEYDYTIYIDGKIIISGNLKEYINAYCRKSTMLCFPHPSRTNLRDEAVHVAQLGKYEFDPMMKQLDSYEDEGYTWSEPVIEGACLIRSNRDPILQKVMEDWWIEICTKTPRDQLSFGYVCWKNNFTYDISTLDVYYNGFLSNQDHNE